MKHTLKVTSALVLFFMLSQIIGLLVINHYIDHKKTTQTKEVAWIPLPYSLERPEVKNQSTSFIYITIAVLIGTLLVFLLIKFKKIFIWKLWLSATIFLTLLIAFSAFVNDIVGAILALTITILRMYKPNIIIHNLSEIFIYGGLASIFVPIINVLGVFILLILISAYDFIAVFRTKHMVKLAKFQSKSKLFSGLVIPYSYVPYKKENKKTSNSVSKLVSKEEQKSSKSAILGGGDIGFTLIFAGVIMKNLMLKETILIGFLKTLIVPTFATMALLFLLIKGQQKKFYPAMPLLSLGCFIGYLIISLI